MVSEVECVVCGAKQLEVGEATAQCRACGAFQSSARLREEWLAHVAKRAAGASEEAERQLGASLAFAACEWRYEWHVEREAAQAIARVVERFRRLTSQASVFVDRREAEQAVAVVDDARRADAEAVEAWRAFAEARTTAASHHAARAFYAACRAWEAVARLGDEDAGEAEARRRQGRLPL